ncbi:MAG: Aminopeptidase N [Cenarchaeum symbiont of Oopsacas minuta]|nr:Aminopeptidase N [Cenarchaeum symbiont of Oopsacas minuta]
MRDLVKPISYKLWFEPDLKKFTFTGKAIILAQCSNTSNIVMNLAELELFSCTVQKGEKIIENTAITNPKSEELEIILDERVSGQISIEIDFLGILNDRLLGFYRSTYVKSGKKRYLATTQFEAADARRAFPCWDRPDAKATFEISLIAKNPNTAISNMPIKSKKNLGNGRILYTFDKTPIMSTYLVYLGVGEFEYTLGKYGKTLVRVITTKGHKKKTAYALYLGKKLLQEYDRYFGIKYPLPKLDLIAIPDFAAGAMENWGAITFRETILLYDPKNSSTRTKQYIAEVISHEIAHQWFGNLVTMEWWNDLWLNESFATYMATKFVDKLYPEWHMWDQFLNDAMTVAMGLDSLKSSHPIDVKVNSPSEIREIFDAISYDKGGCLLRMLEDYVGESKFRAGLRKYLGNHKYGNAKGSDLWYEIGKISHMPVKKIMESWIYQTGFPVIDAKRSKNRILLKQKRFLRYGKKGSGRWPVPITVGFEKPTSKMLLNAASGSMPAPKDALGYIVNHGRKGFYRVRYDEESILDLKYAVQTKKISSVDRWAVQNDMHEMCLQGSIPVREYLDFTDAYLAETSALVCSDVATNLSTIHHRSLGEPFEQILRNYASNFFERILMRLGWDPIKDESHKDAMLRVQAISALGRLGSIHVQKEACKRFEKYVKNHNTLAADLRESVYSLYAWSVNSQLAHTRLVRMYKNAVSQEEKQRFLSALCSFRDEKLLLKTLNFSLTSDVRSQNMQLPVMRVAANPNGKKILWPWLCKNWKKLSSKVGHGNPLLNRLVSSIALVADSNKVPQIKKFFKKNPTPGTERTLLQVFERIAINEAFLRRSRIEFDTRFN